MVENRGGRLGTAYVAAAVTRRVFDSLCRTTSPRYHNLWQITTSETAAGYNAGPGANNEQIHPATLVLALPASFVLIISLA